MRSVTKWLQKISLVTLSSLMAVGTLGLGTAPAWADGGNSCQEITRTVAIGPGLPADQTVRGTLCVPAHFNGDSAVDVLVHGATYNRAYWDWPTNSPQYSYVQRTLLAGRATLAYDRLGAGTSSRPVSTSVTIGADAYVLHQLIDWLRTNQHFAQVNVVGHSFGSIVAINEAATYNDANRLVVTGLLHAQTTGQTEATADFYPAAFDPQFATAGLDLGYLTTVPGSRGPVFYSSIADPAVIAYDEARKDIVSGTQFGDGLGETFTPAPLNISQGIHIPVLVVVGTSDFLFCTGAVDCNSQLAVAANERPYYTNAPSVRVERIDNTGHDLNLHPTLNATFLRINFWINNH